MHRSVFPANRLTEAERDRIVATCNTPESASLPPSQIVPKLADAGVYIASESSFYRVLRERGQNHRRGRARRPGRSRPPASFQAKGPCEVWSWDITWLPGPVPGMFFHLYLIVDIFSRKITGWEVHERESAALAAGLLERAVRAEGCVISPLVLHADNGSPMKGAAMKVTMERLGVTPSFSRPRVSNDNPFPEALFRTGKYVPTWPAKGFASIEEARAWVMESVRRSQYPASAQRDPLRHPRGAPPRRGPGAAGRPPSGLRTRPRCPPGALVRPHAQLAPRRPGLAQPRTPRHKAQKPWGRRRAPP